MKFRVEIIQPILSEIEASTRDEAWDILQDWLDNQIELIKIREEKEPTSYVFSATNPKVFELPK